MRAGDLGLHEELLLMALHDKKGTVASGSSYPYALGGAILAELLMEERITLVKEKKKQFVELTKYARMEDDVLAEAVEKVRDAKRRATVQTWVSRFAGLKRLKHRVAKRLCRRGILRADEETVLLLFRRTVYPEINPRPERRMIERLRQALFSESANLDPRTVVLVSLAHGAGLLKHVFDKKELKNRKDRIQQIVDGEVVGSAAKAAMEAAQAALVVATVVPTVVASASSG